MFLNYLTYQAWEDISFSILEAKCVWCSNILKKLYNTYINEGSTSYPVGPEADTAIDYALRFENLLALGETSLGTENLRSTDGTDLTVCPGGKTGIPAGMTATQYRSCTRFLPYTIPHL